MVSCARIEKERAEEIRRQLSADGLIDFSFVPQRKGKFVYFAVKGKPKGLTVVEKKLDKREEFGKPLSSELAGKLTARESEELVKSFDIVGDIAVLEIPAALEKKEKLIALAVMKLHHNVKVVAKKIGGTCGEFRIRPVKVIAGEKRTSTVYREGGCLFALDLNKSYFSSRLGTERERIAKLVKSGERVLVPFAGVGPFAIRIGKTVPKAAVAGIELNPDAFEYFQANIARNKCRNVTAIMGDVSSVLPGKFALWADRVAMPLPKDGGSFLASIIPCLKKGGTLHYYSFGDVGRPFDFAEQQVGMEAAKLGRKCKIAFRRIVRPYSKTTVQVVVDAKIS